MAHDLNKLLREALSTSKATPEQKATALAFSRRSWAIGELMMDEEIDYKEAAARIDAAIANGA